MIREEKGPSFNIRLFLLQYLRYWYLFIVFVALTLGAATLYLRYTTPVYLVNAVLLIREKPSNAGDRILGIAGEDPRGSQLENEVELLKSRGLMLRVVDALNLTVRYYKEGKIARDEELYDTSPIFVRANTLTPSAYQGPIFVNLLNRQQYELLDKEGQRKGKYRFNEEVVSPYGRLHVLLRDSLYRQNSPVKVVFIDREQAAKHYQGIFRVASSLSSSILKLYLEDAVPARGKALVNKILELHAQAALEDKNLEAKYTLQFVNERLGLITNELGSVEGAVESYRNTQGITDLGSQASRYLEAATTSDVKLNQVALDLQVLDGVENYLKNSQSGALPSMLTLNDPLLTNQLSKLGELQDQHEKYSRTMQAGNPFLQDAAARVASAKNAILENIAHLRQNLQLSRSNVQQFSNRSQSSMQAVPRKERELVSIKRQQEIKEELYLLLLRRKEQAAIAYASAVTDSRVVDYASSTSAPLKPSKANAYMVALLIGFLIPAGGITIRSRLNNKVKSRNDIENETGITVFGEIMRRPQSKKENDKLSGTGFETNKVIAEQFKLLRANLPYTNGIETDADSQVILVTSSISGEGKSFFSINLSHSLAQLDKRVVVVESDLRKPKTTTYLGMSNEHVTGLSDYLSGQCELHDLLRPTDQENLYLISSGPVPANPTELLSHKRMGVLLTELRKQFDYILLDTPPVSFVADTTLLAQYADNVFYLVRDNYTPRSCMQLLSGLSANQKFKSLHVIFNGVAYEKSKEAAYGYDYRQVLN